MLYSIFDIETDGFNPTKIHCLSVRYYRGSELLNKVTFTDYSDMVEYFQGELVIAGHNIIRFDIPVAERILGIKIDCRIIDTLGLSWYLYPQMKKHGLEHWGELFGIPKPKIVDWKNLPVEEYIYRCEEDVHINSTLFNMQMELILKIYGSLEAADRMINYITFKLNCAKEQEDVKWKLDIERCNLYLTELYQESTAKFEALAEAMPESVKTKMVTKPVGTIKKDGQISVSGAKWYYLLGERGLSIDHEDPIEVEISRERGNPNSPEQLKEWLYSLGWKPDVFKHVKDKDKDGNDIMRAVPQICNDDEEKTLSNSVQALVEVTPVLVNLQGLYLLRHRIGILEGFLENADENDYLMAQVQGFTNTMRFQHTTIVNLPTIFKPYGEKMRGVLTHPEGMTLCGSDMSSLEDTTKQHYIYFYDPDYVIAMRTPGFDPHLDIAELSGMLSNEQVKEHKLYEQTKGEQGKSHKGVRGKAKKTNFTATYGAGPPKIALAAGIPIIEAKIMHGTYWKRNWAVKKIARDCTVQTVEGQMWLFNPISQFWYSLRFDKDRFSTLNQGTGVYVFDSYVRQVRNRGIKLCGQFHDEIVFPLIPEDQEQVKVKLNEAIKDVNDELKLNVPLGISMDFGHYYSDIH